MIKYLKNNHNFEFLLLDNTSSTIVAKDQYSFMYYVDNNNTINGSFVNNILIKKIKSLKEGFEKIFSQNLRNQQIRLDHPKGD